MRDEEKTSEQLLAELETLRAKFSELKKAESECKWVDAALRESEERYMRLLESVTDYIYTVLIENGRPVSTSHGLGCIAVTGYTSEHYQMYPNLWYEMIHEEDRKAVLDQAEKLLKGETVQPLEHRIIHKDGSIRWVRNTPVPHYDTDGDIVSYDGIIVDVTERKLAEEKMRLSEERFSKAFFASPAGMTITRIADGKFIDVNDSFLRMFEYSREEVIGHTSTELNMWTQEERKKLIQKQLESGGLNDFELQARSKTGRFVIILFSSNPIDLEGETCHITTMIDITERKRAEDALRKSEEKLQKIINGSSAVIFVKDLNGKYLLINSLFEKLFHVSKNDIIGKTDYDIFPKEDADAFIDADKKALMANEPVEAEEVVPQDDGLHYYISSKFPLYDVQGKPYAVCGIATDITERKKAEEALRERERLLSETGRMAHVGGWEFDTETLKGTWTEEVARIHEMDPEAPTTAPLGLSFYHGESRRKIELAVKEAIEQGKPYDLELELVTAKGNHRWVRTIGQPVKEGNKVVKVRGSFQDITESKKAEERIKQEMEITSHLLMISEATSGMTDIDKLIEQVVRCVHEITECDVCLSYLWDVEAKVFSPSQALGLSHELIPLFKTESLDMKVGFVKEAMKKKEPVIKEVGAVHELPLQWIEDINTIAVIPLIGRKGPLGLLAGIYSAPCTPHSEFEDRDMKVMKGISHQVSIALDEARLFKESVDRAMELSHRIETIKTMHEIDRSILSALEPKEILETTTRLVAKLIPCDRATVVNVDRERQVFSWGAGFGTPFLEGLSSAPLEETSAAEVVKTGRTEYVANLLDINDPLPIEKGLVKEGFLSHIRVPIMAKGEVSGILAIGAKRPSAFTPKDLSTLEYLGAQIGVALENARLISDLRELFLGIVKTLSSTIDAKSPWTAGHSERVTRYALDIGKEMRLSEKELKNLELAGLLHDMGKIGTYEYILDKPDRLTDDETKIMRQHPGKGANILSPIKQLMPIIPAIKYHHEFYDGTGYPDGLLGTAIPLFARVLTVADTVDAMGADRPYRKGRAMDVIIAELKRCSGTQFDPKVVEAFLRTV